MQPLTLKYLPAAPALPSGQRLRARVSQKAVVEFARGFSVMIGARLTMIEALDSAAAQCRDGRLRQILSELKKDLERGLSLSAGMARHPAAFDRLFAHLVRVGEAAGVLPEMLDRIATYLEKSAGLKRKVQLAMVYPAVVLTVALAAVAFLLLVIVPVFAEMFQDFGADLPGPTLIVLRLSHMLADNILWVLGGGVLFVFGLKYVKNTPAGRYRWDTLVFKIPLIGSLVRDSTVARFCRTLATLLHGGVSLIDALNTLSSVSPNVRVRETVQAMSVAVTRGGRLSHPLAKSDVFPPMVTRMITVGEETARLDEMLFHVAEHYEKQVDGLVDSLTSIIEPVLIVLLGIVLGGILIAMYLPLFDLMHVVG